ncbi:MAG: amino acid adenylation domain-containing protein [Bacteroidota bacterium]
MKLKEKLLSQGISLLLVDDSIKIKSPKGVLTKALIGEIKENKEMLLEYLRAEGDLLAIPERYGYPVTPSQRRFWMLSHFDGGTAAYNISEVLHLKGDLNFPVFSKSINKIVERHESLRTSLKEDEFGNLKQFVCSYQDLAFETEMEDVSDKNEDYIHDLLHKHSSTSFDLSQPPLFKVLVLKQASNQYLLQIVIHHTIADGWSLEVLKKEIVLYYNNLLENPQFSLPELNIQYKDFAFWTLSEKEQSTMLESKAFWQNKLAGGLPILTLPSALSRPAMKTFNGARVLHSFTPAFTTALRQFTQKNNATMFMGLLAGLNGLFYRYTGQKDIILGTPVANRNHSDFKDQIGLYLNTLPIRTEFDTQDNFASLLEIQKGVLSDAFAHQAYPFDSLIDDLKIDRHPSRSPLFDVFIIYQNQADLFEENVQLENLQISEYSKFQLDRSHFDLNFTFFEKSENLHVELEYNTDIHTVDFAQKLLNHFEAFVLNGLANTEKSIASIEYVTAEEKDILLYQNNPTIDNSFNPITIVDLIKKQAVKTPDAIALVYEDREFSYAELDKQTDRLAAFFNERYNVISGDFVSVKIERDEWLLISIIAILKTGGAYVPLDLEYPADRIAWIEKDSKCKFSVTQEVLDEFKKEASTSFNWSPVDIDAGKPAYIFYTSGSTGNPKGVVVTHANAVALLEWSIDEFSDTDFDVLLASTSHCFDLSIYEFFYPLSVGKRIRLLPNALYLKEYLSREQKILINTVPSAMDALVKSKPDFSEVVAVNLCGETVPISLSNAIVQHGVEFRNLYGPSEDTTYSTVFKVEQKYHHSIPIGVPITNTQICVLSEGLTLQGIGHAGEICLSGTGLAMGYLNRLDLTQDKFISHPYYEDALMYKTGDIGYWGDDGILMFIGRKDHQVKLRGFRIELEEIEFKLCEYPQISNAVVVIKEENNEKHITAYVTGDDIDLNGAQQYISEKLPPYMLPTYYAVLDVLPKTPNGKVDRLSLLKVPVFSLNTSAYEAPTTATEKQLAAIWSEYLEVDQIGINDGFFELGGNSLQQIKILSEINETFEIEVELEQLLTASTLQSLTKVVDDKVHQKVNSDVRKSQQDELQDILGNKDLILKLEEEGYPVTSSQKRLWLLSHYDGGNLAYNISETLVLEGALRLDILSKTFDLLIEKHESFRTAIKEDAKGELKLFIHDKATIDFQVAYEDYLGKDDDVVHAALDQKLMTPFDLSQAPLLRASVLKLADNKHLLVLVIHHVIIDGWSIEIFKRELIQSYNQLLIDENFKLPGLAIQYKHYAYWLNSAARQEKMSKAKEFWHNQFSNEIPVLNLPAPLKRPKLKTFNGAKIQHHFSTSFCNSIKQLCKENNASLFMGLMAGLNGMFYRYTGQTDIVLGTPIANREHLNLHDQIGLYLNTLAIRTNFETTDDLATLVKKQREVLLESYLHKDYPFDLLVEELGAGGDKSRSPLFDVLVVLHNQQTLFEEENLESLAISKYDKYELNRSHFDLSFSFYEKEDLYLELEYNTDIYNSDFAKKIIGHFENFIQNCIAQSDKNIAQVEYVSQPESTRLLYVHNPPIDQHEISITIVDLFKEQAQKTPDAIALVYEDRQLSYQELDSRTDKLAAYLMQKQQILPGAFVSIKLERSEWLLISIIAVLKSGAAYVPLDLNYPKERIEWIEKDSDCQLTIDQVLIDHYLNEEVELEGYNPISIDAQTTAYIIYTSGSTGTPKGVPLTHANAVALLEWSREEYAQTDFNVILAATSHCFDLSIYEFFYPLSVGKRIRLLPNALYLKEYLATEQKIMINTVPSVMDALVKNNASFENVTAINLAGEPIPIALSNTIVGLEVEFRNLYGPSEDTTYSTIYRVQEEHQNPIPIGVPISNTQVCVLSDGLTLQATGHIGEICISGAGLAKGYLNRKELSSERFIVHPYFENTLMYKTGDLGYWSADGILMYVGRKDHQIKLRGFRIELGEIEFKLSEMPQISNAVAMIKEMEGEKHITTFITGKSVDVNLVHQNLSKQLPAYMLPSYYAIMDEIPMTPNGKVDKKQLAKEEVFSIRSTTYEAPNTDTEKQLVEIWNQHLSTEQIGIKDSYFELGGTSLQQIKILHDINERFDIDIDVNTLLRAETIEELAKAIDDTIIMKKGINTSTTDDLEEVTDYESNIWEI